MPRVAEPLRVLILPGPTEIGLEVARGLAPHRQIEVHSAAQPGPGHGPYAFARHWDLPSVHDPAFAEALAALAGRARLDLVYPAHDDVLAALADLDPAPPVGVVGSPPATVRTCRSKTATYRALAGVVPVPAVLDPAAVDEFPVFCKPDRGQGSQGARRVDDPVALARAAADPALIFLQHLPGDEYTVDCFSSLDREVRFVGGRRRVRTRSGISMRTEPVDDPRFADLAGRIASVLELVGGWFFQVKEDAGGELVLLEVAPRVAGTSGLQRVRGVNLPLLSVYAALGVDVRVDPLPVDVVLDRALVNRYSGAPDYDVLYVDLDDTLVVRGAVHDGAIRLVFQCLNRGVRVELVTRHRDDLDATLARHRLAGLFDAVHHLRADEPKSTVVTGPRAVFVDDSWSERAEVRAATGVPGFDLSMLDLLLDDRM